MNENSVPVVPEGGNTKTPSVSPKLGNATSKKKTINPAKRWCFTLNNYTEDEISSIVPTINSKCAVAIVGKEVGENGTPHLQGYIEFKKKSRPFTHFKLKRIHWEKCKGTREENVEYCSKELNPLLLLGVEKPYTISFPNFYKWEKIILDTLDQEPSDRKIHWIWEETGCAGKTSFCKYVFLNYKNVVVLSGKAADMKNCIIDYKNTNNCLPRVVLIDIPRSTNTDFLSYQGIEEIKNMFFYSGKYEGGMVCGRPPHMFIFANEPPNYSKCSEDRWIVMDIGEDD